jgi:hypothetical protein
VKRDAIWLGQPDDGENMDQHVATVEFTDGVWRPVFGPASADRFGELRGAQPPLTLEVEVVPVADLANQHVFRDRSDALNSSTGERQ